MRQYSPRLEELMRRFTLDPKDGLVEAARCPRCRRRVGGIYEADGVQYLFAHGGRSETLISYVVEDPAWWAELPPEYDPPLDGVPGKLRAIRSRNEYTGMITPIWRAGAGSITLTGICPLCNSIMRVSSTSSGTLSVTTRRPG